MYPYVYRAMLSHMLDDPTNEVCGLIIGHESSPNEVTALAYKPINNVHEDTLAGFTLDPEQMLYTIEHSVQDIGSTQIRTIGCFHTHPHWSANPSGTDLDYAQTFENDFPWLIYGAMEGTVKYWHYKDQKFHPGQINMIRGVDLVNTNNKILEKLGLR